MNLDCHYRTYRITLHPRGEVLTARPGEVLKDTLERGGISFPNNCGGKGLCRGCRVEYLTSPPPPTELERRWFAEESLCRMACQHCVENDLSLRVTASIESGRYKRLSGFRLPGGGSGGLIAVDLGTTTVAVYLFELNKGELFGWRSFLNPQIVQGGDVMSRLTAARDISSLRELSDSIRQRLAKEIHCLLNAAGIAAQEVQAVTIAGNTAMTHFWRGESGSGLGRAPFRSTLEGEGALSFDPSWLGLPNCCHCLTLPVLGGFIGGDTTAAILSAGLDEPGETRLLIDLGTNGEIVLAVGESIWAASTAAGPAFEGVGMSAGMPAVAGAIEAVKPDGTPIVIGDTAPLGFCGSGYISALAFLLDQNLLTPGGLLARDESGQRRWTPDSTLNLCPYIVQDDIRLFQLAKGAIAAGIDILCNEADILPLQIERLILTGSFGYCIDTSASVRLGLIPALPPTRIYPLDNAAGRGAALFGNDVSVRERAESLPRRIRVVNLGDHPRFQELFVERMSLGTLTGG